MQNVGVTGTRTRELARPGVHLQRVFAVVEGCEHAVGRAGPILVGGMQRCAAGRADESLRGGAGQRCVEIDRADVAVERPGIAVDALITE